MWPVTGRDTELGSGALRCRRALADSPLPDTPGSLWHMGTADFEDLGIQQTRMNTDGPGGVEPPPLRRA
jgi:hypothetical protein